jgi:hypothetical protein
MVEVSVNAPKPFPKDAMWGAGWAIGYQTDKTESYHVLWAYNEKVREYAFEHLSMQMDKEPASVVSNISS